MSFTSSPVGGIVNALGNANAYGGLSPLNTEGSFSNALAAALLGTEEAGEGGKSLFKEGGAGISPLLLLMLASGVRQEAGFAMISSLASALKAKPGAALSGDIAKKAISAYSLPYSQVAAGAAKPVNYNTSLGIPKNGSLPANPPITGSEANRNAELYTAVIAQFDVANNPRYAVNKRGNGDTYCNIFMWDVTRAMGAEIPHYVNPQTQEPMYYPDIKGAKHMSANRIYDWLGSVGSKYGWHEVSAEQAQMLANEGRPVVTTLKNNSGHGHVQVVCPSKDGKYDAARGVTIAQAGRRLFEYTSIKNIYNASLPKVKYYAHR
ncbi:MAG: hypothetical protein ACOYJD_00135 [Christensenellales bacterium]